MAVAARRITVVVEGQTSELQAALSKAIEGLQGLAEQVAKQAKQSVALNQQTIKSNVAVGDSYTATADKAKRASTIVVESLRTQVRAQADLAATSTRTGAEQAAAADEGAKASEGAARAAVSAAQRQVAASREVQDAALKSAQEQTAAADKVTAAQRKNAEGSVAANATQSKGFAASGGTLARWGKTSLAAILAVAAGSVYASAKYEKATTQYVTQAGVGVKASQQIAKGILRMAGEVGGTPNQLAGGMYHIVSSMNNLIPAANRVNVELGVLRESAKLAKIGGSNLTETTYVLSSAMNALGEHSIPTAKRAAAELNAIVGSGDMHMQDLVGAMSTGILPAVQTFGVSLHSVGAALAYMTDRGVPAQQAATRLRMAITMMGAPTKMAAKLLQTIGMSSTEATARSAAMSALLEKSGLSITRLAYDLRQPDGILVALHDLKSSMTDAGVTAQGQAALIARAFGGARSGTAIEMLFEHPEVLQAKYKQQERIINQYGADWERTKHTVVFQADAMMASIEALGIKLGMVLTPYAITAMNALKGVATWFAHNEAAALSLAGVITGVVGVAITAFILSRLLKLVDALKQVGRASEYLRNGFRSSAAVAAESTAAGTASAAAGASSPLLGSGARGMIGGARSGLGLPGSVMNPIVVAIEAGQYAGLGGQAAAGTVTAASASEEKALASEARGSAAAAGSAGVSTAEEAAITGGVMNSVRSGLGTVLDRAMKGGMVAAVGTLLAQVAGSAIGGKAGQTVASVGNTAALGAAIGTVIEPGIGTAIGAALGGVAPIVVKALGLGDTQGSHVVEHAAAGMNETAQRGIKEGIDKANKTYAETVRKVNEENANGLEKWSDNLSHTLSQLTGGIIQENQHEGRLTGAQEEHMRGAKARQQLELYERGKPFGQAIAGEGMQATAAFGPIERLAALVRNVETRLSDKNLPEAARKGAFAAIMAMVQTYQEKGQLPPTAVSEMLHQVEAKLPSLKQAFGGVGIESVGQLNQALKGQKTLTGVEQLVNNWQKILPELPHIVGINMGNAATTFQQVMNKLLQLSHSGPEAQRISAGTLYKKMRDEEVKYFGETRTGIEGEIKHLSSRMGPITAQGTMALEQAYERMRQVIEQEVSSGVKATAKGTQQINSILTQELKAIGLKAPSKANQSFGPMPGGGGNALQETNIGGSSGFQGLGHARGGLIQFGAAGDRGADTIPISFGGRNIMVGSGELGAVLTGQQQQVANSYLSPIGGLPGLFSKYRTPHGIGSGRGFATGGFVADPGTNFTYGQEPQIVSDLRKLAVLMKTTIYGISGYRSPAHSVAVGGFANDPHTRGEAADIGVGSDTLASASALTAAILAKVGLERPFYPASAHEINHVQLLGSLGHPAGGARGPAGTEAAAMAAVAKAIKAPRVAGSSVFDRIAQAALNKIAAAANQQLGAAGASAGGAGSFAGVKGHGGTPSANEQLGRAMMVAAGWGAGEWPSLQALWTQESGWNANSVNPSSGAYGIPQSLGHGHPYNLGDARAQIAWGLKYIRERYGSPGAAEAHERAFNWYARGGILGYAARGHLTKDTPHVSHSTATSIKNKILKGKGTKPRLTKSSALKASKSLAKLRDIAGLSAIPQLAATAFDKPLEALANQEGLLDQMSGDAHGFFVVPGDMQYINPTLQPGETIGAGMNVLDAQAVNRAFVVKAGETEALKLQQEILAWVAGQASHRLLDGSDIGIVSGTFGPAGLSFAPNQPLLSAEQMNLKHQLNLMGAFGGSGAEAPWLENVATEITVAHNARHQRDEHIRDVQEAAYKRYTHLKGQIQQLTTGSLRERVQAAKDTYNEKVRQFDAGEHRRALKDAIAEEKKVPKQHRDEGLIQQHERELREIVTAKRPTGASIKAAEVALFKNELTGELKPIEETLHRLGGSSTSIGSGGQYGAIVKEAKVLLEKGGEVGAMVETLRTSKIPSAKMSLRSVEEAMQDSPVPVAVKTGAGAGENTMLTSLLEQQNRILATNYAVSQTQFAVLSAFMAGGLPRYERGGLVRNTGLALVHEGEWITPNPKGPYGSQMMANGAPGAGAGITVEPHFHVHGSVEPLINLIDSRIKHPSNVEVVSKTIQRRTRNNPSFR